MPGPKTIRALERGLQVLDALRASPIASLHDIYGATRIPKPTLLRILHTLDRAGLVSRRLADGHYRLTTYTGGVRKRDRHDRVAEAAAPVLVRLCEKVKWPSDLVVPAGDHMEKRETSRPHSPFVLPGLPEQVGEQVGWLMSASGVPISHGVLRGSGRRFSRNCGSTTDPGTGSRRTRNGSTRYWLRRASGGMPRATQATRGVARTVTDWPPLP